MKTCWFVVVHSRGQWFVDREGRAFGPFVTQEEAQHEARRLAEVFGDPLRQSLVFAPHANGRYELVWTGSDPTGAV